MLWINWLAAMVMKSMYITSAMGRNPRMAAPPAAPTTAASLMAVSITRLGPNSSSRPRVTA